MEATAQATPQQLQAKATLDANRARDRKTADAPAPAPTPEEDVKGEATRLMLDRATFAGGLTGVGILVAWLIMNARSLGTMLKKTRLGTIRFNAKSVFEMLPNAQKMRPFTFTPIIGITSTGVVNLLIGLIIALNFLVMFIPAYIFANPIDAARIFGTSILRMYF